MTLFEWAPLVDIVDSDNEYLMKIELREVERDDVKVTVQDSTLMISGERTIEKEEKGRKYHRAERAYGHFARSFTLPEDVDPSRIHAEFKDGVFNVHLAKTEHARPKRVEVEVAFLQTGRLIRRRTLASFLARVASRPSSTNLEASCPTQQIPFEALVLPAM